MEIESLFCKVETAKRLAKLNIKTLYVHHNDKEGLVLPREQYPQSDLPAFSGAELGIMLGSWAKDVHCDNSGKWFICRTDVIKRTMYDTEAEASAQYLILLLNTQQTDSSNVIARYNKQKKQNE